MAQIIWGRNKKATGSSTKMITKGYNCRSQSCPLEVKCKTTTLVYRSTVEAAGTTKQYIGLTSNAFKESFTGHLHPPQACPQDDPLKPHLGAEGSANHLQSTLVHSQSCAIIQQEGVSICHFCLTEKTHISLADPRTTQSKRN